MIMRSTSSDGSLSNSSRRQGRSKSPLRSRGTVSTSPSSPNENLDDTLEEELNCLLDAPTAKQLVQKTGQRVSQVVAQSRFLKNHGRFDALPILDYADMVLGPARPSSNPETHREHEIEGFASPSHVLLRPSLDRSESAATSKRYVVKQVHPRLLAASNNGRQPQRSQLFSAAMDVLMEAHFLSAVRHKHVVRIHGRSDFASLLDSFRPDHSCFVVLERFQTTLAQKIAHWRDQRQASKATYLENPKLLELSGASRPFWVERLDVCLRVAEAMEYLHSKCHVVHRDLRPENIGFNHEGTVKLAGFRLAVELPTGEGNATYNLAGDVGQKRYMALEVMDQKPYNCKADVWSFAVLLWEAMQLKKPYDGLEDHQIKDCVSCFGERPKVPSNWPKKIQQVLEGGWTDKIEDRLEMKDVVPKLQKLLTKLGNPLIRLPSIDVSSMGFETPSMGLDMPSMGFDMPSFGGLWMDNSSTSNASLLSAKASSLLDKSSHHSLNSRSVSPASQKERSLSPVMDHQRRVQRSLSPVDPAKGGGLRRIPRRGRSRDDEDDCGEKTPKMVERKRIERCLTAPEPRQPASNSKEEPAPRRVSERTQKHNDRAKAMNERIEKHNAEIHKMQQEQQEQAARLEAEKAKEKAGKKAKKLEARRKREEYEKRREARAKARSLSPAPIPRGRAGLRRSISMGNAISVGNNSVDC